MAISTTVIVATAVQAGADAYTVLAINTGIPLGANLGYKLNLLQAEVPFLANNAARSNWEFALSRVSKVSMPNVADNDVLYKNKLEQQIVTSGQMSQDLVIEYEPKSDIIVIEQTIYLLFDTNLTTAINSLSMRLEFEPVKVTLEERVAILQNTIN